MILLCGFFFIRQIDTLWIAMWIVVWMSAGVIHPAGNGSQAGKTARLSTSLACLTHKNGRQTLEAVQHSVDPTCDFSVDNRRSYRGFRL